MTTTPSAWVIAGPVFAAVIAGFIALIVLAFNLYQARQYARRKDFAEALAAVERYAELPYRILRRQDSTPKVRGRIAEFIHEVQQDLLFHRSWIRIQAPQVADAYDSLLRTTREEAGSAMSDAWKTTPIPRDEDVPLKVGLDFPRMAEERIKYIQAVRHELEFPPSRWVRDRLVPRLAERPNNTGRDAN